MVVIADVAGLALAGEAAGFRAANTPAVPVPSRPAATGLTTGPWILFSDLAARPLGPDLPARDIMLHEGALVFEIALPLRRAKVLLAFDRDQFALSLRYDGAGGILFSLRAGGVPVCANGMALPASTGLVRISFAWSASGWVLSCAAGNSPAQVLHGPGRPGLALRDLAALCHPVIGGAMPQRHPALLWFGVARQLPARMQSWVGTDTLVRTPGGLRPAGRLRAGDLVMRADGGAVALRAVQRQTLPARGSHAPVLLRAPWFGATRDALVGTGQRILLTGEGVEDLLGMPGVLAAAGQLVNDTSALVVGDQAVVGTVALDTGGPDLILGDGIALLADNGAADDADWPLLPDYAAAPLRELMGRGRHWVRP